jgi:hypothetical protein
MEDFLKQKLEVKKLMSYHIGTLIIQQLFAIPRKYKNQKPTQRIWWNINKWNSTKYEIRHVVPIMISNFTAHIFEKWNSSLISFTKFSDEIVDDFYIFLLWISF